MRESFTFEEIVKQNERWIYYHIHKLNLHDPYKEYFNEGLVLMRDKRPLATYFETTGAKDRHCFQRTFSRWSNTAWKAAIIRFLD